MYVLVSSLLLASLVVAIPQAQPFCSKLVYDYSTCLDDVEAAVLTNQVTVTGAPKTTRTSTITTTLLPTDFPCYGAQGQRRGEAALQDVQVRAVSTPTCLLAYKSATALSSACSCLATAPTTTKTIKGPASVATATATARASTFQILGPGGNTAQDSDVDGSVTHFYGVDQNSYALYSIANNNGTQCALQDPFGRWAYVRSNIGDALVFESNDRATLNGADYLVECFVDPATMELVCTSRDGSTNKQATGENNYWILTDDATEDFQTFVQPTAS